MNRRTGLIFLHDHMARLCKLYTALVEKSGDERLIQEVRTEIEKLYSKITSITERHLKGGNGDQEARSEEQANPGDFVNGR